MSLVPAARPRAAVVRPRVVAAWATALVALAAAPSAGAQSTTVTFDGLTPVDATGVRYVDNCYVEGGFRFTLVGTACGTEAAFGTWTPDNPLFYTGSPALFNNLGPAVDVSTTSGATFSLASLDLTTFLGGFGNATTVTFMGMLASGGSVMQTVELPGATTTPTRVTFANFANLTGVRMTVTAPDFEPYVQFDNLTATVAASSVVPEPSTYALLASGLATLGGVAYRRRRRSA